VAYIGTNTDEFITYRQFDAVGKVKPVQNWATDFPSVEIRGEEILTRVYSFGNSYSYTLQDMRAAARLNRPLELDKARMARRAHEENLESIAVNGTPSAYSSNSLINVVGLCNAPNILSASAGSGTSGTSWLAGNKTAAQIQADVATILAQVFTTSLGKFMPNTLLVPVAQYSYIATTPYVTSAYSDKTILEWLKQSNPGLNIDFWQPLATAGSGGGTRMMAYYKDPDVLDLVITQEFEQFSPNLEGLQFSIPCHMRTAGVRVKRPMACCYMDGV
jgi:hypothetical protein